MAKFAKRLFAGALAAAVALTTVISSDMTALAAKTKATKIKGSTYTTADLIWEDNFNGNKLNTRYWNYEAHEPGWVNQEWQSYPSQEENEKTQNIYVKDGKLTIQAKKTKNEDGTYSYTSGRINTQNKVDTKYGRFEARIKMPKGKGFLPAFWMMPTDENLYGQWPKCGEIDITEVLGDKPSTAHSTLHFGEPHKQKQGTYTLEKGTFNDDFHVYACEWEPGEMRFYIDNKLFYTENDWFTKKEGFDEVTYPAPYDQPFYIILNLAVGGSWVGYPDKTTKFDENAQMVVDYVKVYQKDSYKENVKKPENKVTVRKPAKDGNYVVNSSFAKSEKLNDGKDWEFMTAGTGKASANISKKALHITTKNAGDLDYSVQVVQANIPMEKGYQYKLSFDAYADKNRTIKTGITAPDNGYIRYFNDTTVNLTTKKKTYSYTFDMKSDTDPNGRVEFNLGNQGSTAGVHISNVKVVRVKKISLKEEKTVRPDGNYVYNGEFQEGADRLNYWTVKKAKGATVKVTNTNNVRQLKAVVPASVKKASDVTLKQTKIAIKGGKTYAFSFDAKRTGAKDQTLTVKVAGKTYKVKLTGKMKNYKFELKPDKGIKNATLEFQLGTKGTTVIDNVRIMESGLIINGDFSAGLTGFEPWANNPSDISYVVDTLNEDSAFCMDIKDTGDQDWHVQLKQTGIKLEKGQSYKVSFKVKGTMERDIKFAFQRNGLVRKTADGAEDWTVYFEDGQIPVTKKWTTYSAIFEMGEGDDADTSMSFSLGAVGGKRITDKHTVMIDDIALEKTDEKPEKEEDDSLILNGHFNKGLAPFEAWAHEAATMESSVNKDKEFEAIISNTGDQDWHAQLKQVNIPLESGQTYTFSFRAKSDIDREIKYAFQKDGNKHNDDWTVYFEESNIPVTKEWKTYTIVFKMNNASDKEASFSFNLGAVGKQIKEKHTVTIDDVSLKVATEEEKKKVKNASAGGGGDVPSSDDTSGGEKLDIIPAETLGTDDAKKSENGFETAAGADIVPIAIGTKGIQIKVTNNGGATQAADSKVPVADLKDIKAGQPSKIVATVYNQNSTSTILSRRVRSVEDTFDTVQFALRKSDGSLIVLENLDGTKEFTLTENVSSIDLIAPSLSETEKSTAKLICYVGKVKSGHSVIVSKVEMKDLSNMLSGIRNDWQNGWGIGYADADKAVGLINKILSGNGVEITISNPGTETWHAQIYKKGLNLEKGATYEFTYTVTATKPWQVNSGVQISADPYTAISETKSTAANTEKQVVNCRFTPTAADENAIFHIDMGANLADTNTGSAVSVADPVKITIENLRMVKVKNAVDGGETPELPQLPEWQGFTISEFDTTSTAQWEAYLKDANSTRNTCAVDNGVVTLDIKNPGDVNWYNQFKQRGYTLNSGEKYDVKFTISSTEARKIEYAFMGSDDATYYGGGSVQLDAGTEKSVDVQVSLNEKLTEKAEDCIFKLSFGKMEEEDTPASVITLKDLVITKVTDESDNTGSGDGGNTTGGNLLENMKVNTVSFTNPATGSAVENKITISNSGTDEWHIQLNSPDLQLEADKRYKVTFDVITDGKEWNIKGQLKDKANASGWNDSTCTAVSWKIGNTAEKFELTYTPKSKLDYNFSILFGNKTDGDGYSLKNPLKEGETVSITITNIRMEVVEQ